MANFSEISDFTSLKSIFSDVCCDSCTVLHVNIRSIREYLDQFKVIAESIEPAVDVFFLTEINLQNVSVTQFNMNGHSAFFRTRQLGRGGGITVFLRNKWIVSHIIAKFDSAECAALEIYYENCPLTLLGVYRPPSSNVLSFLTELKYNLEELRGEESICLIGDFNRDSLKTTKSPVGDYLTLFSSYGIECTILARTREKILNEKLVSSCIDHINVRSSYMSAKSAVISQKLADHYFITCQLSNNYSNDNDRYSRKHVQILDAHRFDNMMQAYDWVAFLNTVDHSTAYSRFADVVSVLRNKGKRSITVRHADQIMFG